MSRQYLKDKELDERLATQGFVVVPMLSEEAVARLKSSFETSHTDGVGGFYATAHHPDTDFRDKMSEAILKELQEGVENTFDHCKLLGGSFIVKTNSDQGHLAPHQDWNIVDEDTFRSFNIWIPLVDLSEENGAIEVLPKSHNWQRGFRHASIPCAYGSVHDLVWENMKPLYLKAGEALIYDHSLLHASKANTTDEPRIAIASGVMPKEAQMLFYWNNDGVIQEYESNPEFFMSQNIFQKPTTLKMLKEIQYDFPQVDARRFYTFLGVEMPSSLVEDSDTSDEPQHVSDADERSFWETYTPMNILREIGYRLRSQG